MMILKHLGRERRTEVRIELPNEGESEVAL